MLSFYDNIVAHGYGKYLLLTFFSHPTKLWMLFFLSLFVQEVINQIILKGN